ncbi:MAG: dTDP-glucose pyrophosphorylase [Pseudohongiellaceae bacterium]|jgi:dTDP-glucose pyrophosphorylase
MKALVLAGGRGSRLESITETTNKCMLPLAGRPLIEHSLANALSAGVDEIVIVVGHLAEQIINSVGNCFEGVPVKYVIQWEQRGLVHAVECARATIEGADFMLFLADEVFVDPRHPEMIEMFMNEELAVLCGTIEVEDRTQITKTYSIITGSHDEIHRLIEKPANPMNDIMGTGNCVFTNRIFDYIATTPINQQRGEKELPDLIQCAIDDGQSVKHFLVGRLYVNVNTPDEIARAEQAVLQS